MDSYHIDNVKPAPFAGISSWKDSAPQEELLLRIGILKILWTVASSK